MRIVRRFGVRVPLDFKTYRDKSLNHLLSRTVDLELEDKLNKKLLVIKSAESDGTTKELLYGDLDFELNQRGIEHSEYLAREFKPYLSKIGGFWSSSRKRAIQTASIIMNGEKSLVTDNLSKLKIPSDLQIDKRLDEFNFGQIEGVSIENMRFVERDLTWDIFYSGRLERDDIETPESVVNRTCEAFKELKGGDCVNLMVTHRGVMHTMTKKLHMEGLFLHSCSCLLFEINIDGTPERLINFWHEKTF